MQQNFPFSAIVGQDLMKKALLLNVVDPTIGGVLIKGERGTAKSTGVRALIDLLPTIRVAAGCPFQCDPDDTENLCRYCREKSASGQQPVSKERKVRLVNLPIGATEDRLLGTIDMERALKTGQKAFEPGLLADAHRGILYVDEVNLLNDQIVDLFLDAAASGMNVVEREGVSFTHASRFVLVGTMNPEEGDLRPQLLDRFGLCVSIEGIHSLPDRVEIIKRRLAFEQEPDAFRKNWAGADAEMARRIEAAESGLPEVAFTEALLETAAKIAVAMETDGHRADIVMMKAARANAALEGRRKVSMDDLQLAARLVLPHRIGKSPLRKAELNHEKLKEILEHSASAATPGEEWTPVYQNKPRQGPQTSAYRSPMDCVTHLCAGSRLMRPEVPWRRLAGGNHPGRRFIVRGPQQSGVAYGSKILGPGELPRDVSIMSTLRAAAPYQRVRGRDESLKIQWQDLRLRRRSRKTGLALVMIVDSSASMRTNDRMSVTKGIIDALLKDLYLRRDKLGIITFRHTEAEVLMDLSPNIRGAAENIEQLPVGGRTPLAAGLDLGIRMLVQEKRKNPESQPAMLLFSDGRPNVSSYGGEPLEETYFFAREVKRQSIQAMLVDTEYNPMSSGCGYEIAQRMGATYLMMDRLFK